MPSSRAKALVKQFIPDPLLDARGRALHMFRDLMEVPRLVDEVRTYYPAAKRKSKARILLENMWWRWRHRQLNNHYFLYGLDRRGASLSDCLPHPDFARIRDRGNEDAYTGLLRDKFVFAQLARSLGHATPELLARIDGSTLEWLTPRRTRRPLDALLERDLDAVAKPLRGGQGRGVFRLRTDQGSLFVDGVSASVASLRDRLAERYVLQRRIEQHTALAALHPRSVNTLRLVTAQRNGAVELLSAALRVGAGGSSTDNWSRGGLAAYVDADSGATRTPGVFKHGPRTTVARHPDTGVSLDGYPIPHFPEALALARRCHADLPGLRTVGWDVAITPNGPTLLEGNSEYGGSIHQAVDDEFADRFLALFDEA